MGPLVTRPAFSNLTFITKAQHQTPTYNYVYNVPCVFFFYIFISVFRYQGKVWRAANTKHLWNGDLNDSPSPVLCYHSDAGGARLWSSILCHCCYDVCSIQTWTLTPARRQGGSIYRRSGKTTKLPCAVGIIPPCKVSCVPGTCFRDPDQKHVWASVICWAFSRVRCVIRWRRCSDQTWTEVCDRLRLVSRWRIVKMEWLFVYKYIFITWTKCVAPCGCFRLCSPKQISLFPNNIGILLVKF